MQLEKESKSVGLKKKDAMNRARWRVGVGEIAVRVGCMGFVEIIQEIKTKMYFSKNHVGANCW